MLRTLWLLIVLGALTVATVWLANNPGSVILHWQGYRADTSVAVLLGAVAAVAAVAAVLYRFWVFLRQAPATLARMRRERQRRRGYVALTRGMVAVAAGDAAGARRQVKRARGLLGDPALTLLLSAQAAQLSGDENAAAGYFQDLLEAPETEFLGLRGLLTQAMKRGEKDRAIALAGQAHRLRPKSEWVARTLFDLETSAGRWADAEDTLGAAIKHRLVPADESSRHRAVLVHLSSLEAESVEEPARALSLARKANGLDAGFVPAALRLSLLLLDAGQGGKAATVLRAAWSARPHPDLVAPWLRSHDATDPLMRASQVEKLIAASPDHVESHLAVARAALDARLWGKARKHLIAATGDDPPARVCRLMAELEEAEHGHMDKARHWLMRASVADPDPAWVCAQCGDAAKAWSALCPKCGRFDGLEWETPPRVTALAPAGAALERAPAGAALERAPAGAATDRGPAGAATDGAPAGAALERAPAGAALDSGGTDTAHADLGVAEPSGPAADTR